MLQKLFLSVSLPVFWGLSVFLVGQFSGVFGAGRVPLMVYYAHLIAAPLLFFICGFFAAAVMRRTVLSGMAAACCYGFYMLAVLAGQYGFQIALLRFDAACGAVLAVLLAVTAQSAVMRLLSAATDGSA